MGLDISDLIKVNKDNKEIEEAEKIRKDILSSMTKDLRYSLSREYEFKDLLKKQQRLADKKVWANLKTRLFEANVSNFNVVAPKTTNNFSTEKLKEITFKIIESLNNKSKSNELLKHYMKDFIRPDDDNYLEKLLPNSKSIQDLKDNIKKIISDFDKNTEALKNLPQKKNNKKETYKEEMERIFKKILDHIKEEPLNNENIAKLKGLNSFTNEEIDKLFFPKGHKALEFKNVDILTTVNAEATKLTTNKQLDFDLDNCHCNYIASMIKAGADFLQNFFEVAFVFKNKIEQNNSFERLLYTRVGSITIPRLKAKTFTVKTIRGGVEKIASRLEGSYDVNLTIRLDQRCYVLDVFSKMFGDFEGSEPKIYPASSIFNSGDIGFGKNQRIDILVKDISGFEHRTFNDTTSNKFKQFNKLLLESTNTKPWVKLNTPNVKLNAKQCSEWVLEDVRIVDISDSEWSFDTTSPTEVTLQLIAKSVYHREANFV